MNRVEGAGLRTVWPFAIAPGGSNDPEKAEAEHRHGQPTVYAIPGNALGW